MTTIPDHYAALGIDPTADPEVITAAYRALAKKFHPDTGANTGTADAARFDAIQQAYEVLRNPDSRHAYDLELLEATERELAEHIASKRRVVLRERRAEQAQASAPPPPDLGDIRPEPATPPRGTPQPHGRRPRSVLPFAVPLVLVMLVGGAAAWLLLPAGPEAPPLPQVAATAPAAPKPAETQPAEIKPADPEPAAATPAAAPAPPQTDAAVDGEPVFGSTGAAPAAPEQQVAAATPQPASASADAGAAKSDKAETPVFGSTASTSMDAPIAAPDMPAPAAAAEAVAPPVPKARPAQAAKPAQKQASAPQKAQPKPQKPSQQAQLQTQQPRARLTYQNPPQYYPEPDGYPPPGYEPGYDEPYPVPPGYEPPGYDAPPGFRPPGSGPYRLVIWERRPGRPATAWSAGMVFKSMGKCTKQGVKAVLRRTGGDPYAEGTRVWYECQQLTQY